MKDSVKFSLIGVTTFIAITGTLTGSFINKGFLERRLSKCNEGSLISCEKIETEYWKKKITNVKSVCNE